MRNGLLLLSLLLMGLRGVEPRTSRLSVQPCETALYIDAKAAKPPLRYDGGSALGCASKRTTAPNPLPLNALTRVEGPKCGFAEVATGCDVRKHFSPLVAGLIFPAFRRKHQTKPQQNLTRLGWFRRRPKSGSVMQSPDCPRPPPVEPDPPSRSYELAEGITLAVALSGGRLWT